MTTETTPAPDGAVSIEPRTANRARNMLVAAHALQHIVTSSLPVLLIFIRQDMGLSFTEMGIILAAGNLTGGLAQFPAGLLVDALGARNLLLIGYGFTLGGMFMFANATTMSAMILARVITGLGNATFHPASFPEMARATKHSGLSMGMALHNVGGNLGSIGYSVAAVLATVTDWRGVTMILSWAGVALAVAFAAFYPRLPVDADELSAREQAKARRQADAASARSATVAGYLPVVALAAAAALSGAFSNTITSFLPSFLTSTRGISATIAGAFATIMMLSGAAGSLGGGRLGDKYDRSLVVLIATAVTALLVATLAWAPIDTLLVVVVLVLIGVVHSIPRPCLNAITSQIAPAGKSGAAFGLVFGAMSLGGSMASPVVGYIADRWSMQLAFGIIGVVFFLHGLWIRRLYAGRFGGTAGTAGTADAAGATGGGGAGTGGTAPGGRG